MIAQLGFGVGFRLPHYSNIRSSYRAEGDNGIKGDTHTDYFELITENFITLGGAPRDKLDWLKERFPLVLHGVNMSLGSVDPLNQEYLRGLKKLIRYCQPTFVTDHLCWTSVGGKYLHDLLPLPYTEEVIRHFVTKINQVQDYLEQPIGVENLSSYLTFRESNMTEWDFLSEIIRQTKCYLMLDINNVYVSSVNHGFDPWSYLANVPIDSICQIHLAGHTTLPNGRKIDTHSAPPCKEVWDLYFKFTKNYGTFNTLIEWDENIPSYTELQAQVLKAKKITQSVVTKDHA